MYAIKGLLIDNGIPHSITTRTPWENNECISSVKPTHSPSAGISAWTDLTNATAYGPHLFLLRLSGDIVKRGSHVRAEHAAIQAYIDIGPEKPDIHIPTVDYTALAGYNIEVGTSAILSGSNHMAILPNYPEEEAYINTSTNVHIYCPNLRCIDINATTNIHIYAPCNTIYVSSRSCPHIIVHAPIHHIDACSLSCSQIIVRGGGSIHTLYIANYSSCIVHEPQGPIHNITLDKAVARIPKSQYIGHVQYTQSTIIEATHNNT